MSRAAGSGDLVFVGDVHVDRDDASLPDFLEFLDRLGRCASRVVFLGDMFNVWIGGRGLESPHQTAVVERLRALRRHGVVVRYLEGNRDYRIGRHYRGTAVDDASDDFLAESFGGHRFFAAHGDLVNVEDRQYRRWRRFSRSKALWGLIELLPARSRVALAESLERRMRRTNIAYKREFPEDQVRAYASGPFRDGFDVVVLGHFHVERDLRVGSSSESGRILVLPEWRESRRHLVARSDGEVAFVDS